MKTVFFKEWKAILNGWGDLVLSCSTDHSAVSAELGLPPHHSLNTSQKLLLIHVSQGGGDLVDKSLKLLFLFLHIWDIT